MEVEKRVEEIQAPHDRGREKITKSNASYQTQANKYKRKVVVLPGDLVWVHLRKDKFPQKIKFELSPRAIEIMERINDKAYRVDLLGEYGLSATFNVVNQSPNLEDIPLKNLRSNSLQ